MTKRWTLDNLKEKGIFVDAKGVGKVLAPKPKKVTQEEIDRAIKKAKKNGINKGKAD
jgi:DNA-binding transcriptional regulator YhcF (GntR family)